MDEIWFLLPFAVLQQHPKLLLCIQACLHATAQSIKYLHSILFYRNTRVAHSWVTEQPPHCFSHTLSRKTTENHHVPPLQGSQKRPRAKKYVRWMWSTLKESGPCNTGSQDKGSVALLGFTLLLCSALLLPKKPLNSKGHWGSIVKDKSIPGKQV